MPPFIKRLNKNEYDVFYGNRWDDWSRIRRNHWGVSVVAGKRLHRNQISQLNDQFNLKKGS